MDITPSVKSLAVVSATMSADDETRGIQTEERREGECKGNDEWDNISLQSPSGSDNVEEDDPLPIPGRESHTADLEEYHLYLSKLRGVKRRPSLDLSFHEGFWTRVEHILQYAVPVGYSDLGCCQEVQHKGPEDNEAFMRKIGATDLINPIHPILLSREFDIPMNQVLTELLYATKIGMMNLRLAPDCRRCGSSVCAVSSLKELPSFGYCEGCRYRNDLDCLDKIKAVFIFNRDIFYFMAESFACQPSEQSIAANMAFAMVPATFSGSGFRYSFGCGGEKELRPVLPAGKYRMHCPVARTDNYLQIERDATDDEAPITHPFHVSDFVCRSHLDQPKTLILEHGKLHLDVFTNTHSFFVLWIQKNLDDDCLLFLPAIERRPYTNAVELLSHPTYQFLFIDKAEDSILSALRRMDNAQVQTEEPTSESKRSSKRRRVTSQDLP